jgi:hypothetical protein
VFYVLDAAGNVVPADNLILMAMSTEDSYRMSVIDRTDVAPGVELVTSFLFMNRGWGGGPPVFFETMWMGGPWDGQRWGWATLAEAIEGHNVRLLEWETSGASADEW